MLGKNYIYAQLFLDEVKIMIISHIALKNWRNFQSVNVDLHDRVFVVGPNACGKSNFLDSLRFLRDMAKAGGGLQKAVSDFLTPSCF
jgi:predicted ATPase